MLKITNLLNRPLSIDYYRSLKPGESRTFDILMNSDLKNLEKIGAISISFSNEPSDNADAPSINSEDSPEPVKRSRRSKE